MTTVNKGYALRSMVATLSAAAAAVRTAEISSNPSSYEIPVKPRGVIDQLRLPCCVSTALSSAMEVLNPSSPQLAPLFHYYVTRFDNGGADASGSLYLENGLSTLTFQGICREDLHRQPYTEEGAVKKPSDDAYLDGKARALGRRQLRVRYSQSEGPSKVVWIREQLRNNCPILLGMQLPDGYPNLFLESDLVWRDPDKPPRTLNGHCVYVFGYDDGRQALHVQDSQGRRKGFENGCWWMGYRVVDSTVVHEVYRLIP
jgi:hypothetical protein